MPATTSANGSAARVHRPAGGARGRSVPTEVAAAHDFTTLPVSVSQMVVKVCGEDRTVRFSFSKSFACSGGITRY